MIAHGLWILGAAVALATVSYYQWFAAEQRLPLRQLRRTARGWKVSIAGSLLLVASGFLLMESARWWERSVWLLIGAGAGINLWRTRRPF